MSSAVTSLSLVEIDEFLEDNTTSSPARVAANRANARRSTGPKTREGKDRSRCNAIKHQMKTIILPRGEDHEVVEAEREEWIACFKPTDAASHRMADLAFRCCRRLETVIEAEEAAIAARVDASLTAFRERRWNDYCKTIEIQPTEAVVARFRLQRTVMGCQTLIEQLDAIDARVKAEEWSAELESQLMMTLGFGAATIALDLPTWTEQLLEHAELLNRLNDPNLGLPTNNPSASISDPSSLMRRDHWDPMRTGSSQAMSAERGGLAQRNAIEAQRREIEAQLDRSTEQASAARASIRRSIATDRAMLNALIDSLDAEEAHAEAVARDQAKFDPSDAARLRHRYLVESRRDLSKSMDDARKAAEAARENEPTPVETPATEAEIEASPNEPKAEKPAPSTRREQPVDPDRSGSPAPTESAGANDLAAPWVPPDR